jgi:hypothetical protein
MLTLECSYSGEMAEETELTPGYEAHLTRFGPGSSSARLVSPKNCGVVCGTRHSNVFPVGRILIAGPSRLSHCFFADFGQENPIRNRTDHEQYDRRCDEYRYVHRYIRKQSLPNRKIGHVPC